MIASVSGSYSGSEMTSLRERAAGALSTWNAYKTSEGYNLEKGQDDWLREIVGDDLYQKVKKYSNAELEYLEDGTPVSLETLTYAEKNYVDKLLTNAQYGILGLTDQQKLKGAIDLQDRILNGTYDRFVADNDAGMISDYASMLTNDTDYLHAAEIMSQHGYGFTELKGIEKNAEIVAELNEALKDTGYTVETYLSTQEDLDRELQYKAISLTNKYGDSTEEVIENMKLWSGANRDAASALNTLNSSMSKAQRNAWLRKQAEDGNWTDEVIDGIAEMTGLESEYVKEHKDNVVGLLDSFKESDIEELQNLFSGYDQKLTEQLNTSPTFKVGIDGAEIDFSEAEAKLAGYVDEEFLKFVKNAMNHGVEGRIIVTQDGDKVSAKLNVTGVNGSGYVGRSSGSGKTAADKLIESQKREQTSRDHIIKMIQYEETMYQNAGELSNYGIMLKHEINEEKRQAEAKQAQIAALKEQIAKTKQYSDDWYSLRDAIMEAEENYEELTNAIEENTDKLEENHQAILKLHTDLEQAVKKEIETRIQEERTMLDGTVSMQDTIVEAIRERYRKEWELMQKDIDKKREALEEEKALIDERLNRRKNAEDEAKKHEELAEYKKQLALVSMDSTRTADAATLREKISELENELAWDLAEDEAKLQQDAIQDQIDAYDQYVSEYQEWLDEYLEDANNFSDEVNNVLGLGHDELIQWLKDNVEAFSNSLDETQEQMVLGWDDTFKKMKGIVDTYWDEINTTLSSKENFIAYMQQSTAYQNASEDEKAQMLYNWGKMYDDYISSSKISQEAIEYTHSDDLSGKSNSSTPSKKQTKNNETEPTDSTSSVIANVATKVASFVGSMVKGFSEIAVGLGGVDKFASGGLVDYTGQAWVDGTKSKPESFLDAEDTSIMRAMLDSFNHIKTMPYMSNVSGVTQNATSNSIGEVNVTLNEAQFNTEDDYEVIAQKVGAAFTKELSKQGFTTASYAF